MYRYAPVSRRGGTRTADQKGLVGQGGLILFPRARRRRSCFQDHADQIPRLRRYSSALYLVTHASGPIFFLPLRVSLARLFPASLAAATTRARRIMNFPPWSLDVRGKLFSSLVGEGELCSTGRKLVEYNRWGLTLMEGRRRMENLLGRMNVGGRVETCKFSGLVREPRVTSGLMLPLGIERGLGGNGRRAAR